MSQKPEFVLVEGVLNPWIGSLILNSSMLSFEIAELISDFSPKQSTLQQMNERISSILITRISRLSNGSMCVILDDYRCKWLTLNDIREIADELMELVFARMMAFSVNYEKINDYAIRQESLSGMKVLLLEYQRYMTEEQREDLIEMIKRIFPKERYQEWISG